MLSNQDGICVFRAVVRNGSIILGTGHAYEKEDSTFINKTSFIENCETSAVGRALAMCGIGIDTSVASKEEVENAINNQPQARETKQNTAIAEAELRTKILAYITRHNMDKTKVEAICKKYGVKSINEMTAQHCKHYIGYLEKNGGNIDE